MLIHHTLSASNTVFCAVAFTDCHCIVDITERDNTNNVSEESGDESDEEGMC